MIYKANTIYKNIDWSDLGEIAKNSWVDISDQIEPMPGITDVYKSFYINELLGLFNFTFKAYASYSSANLIELYKINYSGFVNVGGVAMAIGPNDAQLNTPIPFSVYDVSPGHDHRVVIWPNAYNQAAGATGITGFGILT